jgi:hypothetical protein
MDSSIIIKARPGSGKFKKYTSGLTVIDEHQTETGEKYNVTRGEFLGERYPNTGGYRRPLYSIHKGKWLLVLDNGDEATEDWLNTQVKRAKLRYEGGSENGKLIESADIEDINDAFMNHRLLKVYEDEGFAILNPNKALDTILAAGYRGNQKEVARIGTNNFVQTQRTLISDQKGEEEQVSRRINKKLDASALFHKLTLEKKKRILELLENKELIPDTSEVTINASLYKYIDDGDLTHYTGKTKVDIFIELCKKSHEDLRTLEYMSKAMRLGVIRIFSGKYVFDGKEVATSYDDCANYFSRAENYQEVVKLEKKIGIV